MKRYLVLSLLLTILLTSMLIPMNCVAEDSNDEIFSCYVMDYGTGRELYSKNKDDKHKIASMVKIMTLNLIFENMDKKGLKYDDEISVSQEASSMGGSQMFLDANQNYKINDLIKGIVVCSANDASYAMAEYIAGSHENFVRMMNDKAKELNMSNTLFCNATGLPSDKDQYSTAKDVSIMTRNLIKYPKYLEFASIWLEDFTHPSGRITTLSNTNKLLKTYSNCLSGKTGYTDEAKYCLSASAKKNNLTVISTIIGATSSKYRFSTAKELFNHAFANYSNEKIYKKGDIVGNIKVKNGVKDSVDTLIDEDLYILSMNGKKLYDYEIVLDETIKAPCKKGTVCGKIIIKNGEMTKEIPISVSEDLKKASIIDKIKQIF